MAALAGESQQLLVITIFTLDAGKAKMLNPRTLSICTWGHTPIPETDFVLITQESQAFRRVECHHIKLIFQDLIL